MQCEPRPGGKKWHANPQQKRGLVACNMLEGFEIVHICSNEVMSMSDSRYSRYTGFLCAARRPSLAPVPPDLTVNSRVLVKAVEGEDPLPGRGLPGF